MKYFFQPDPLDVKAYEKFRIKHDNFKKDFEECKTPWILKKEIVKYCEQDVTALLKVLESFKKLLLNDFLVDMTGYPTLPSITFALFRGHYLPVDVKIPIITGAVYADISNAYMGGICEAYTPKGYNVKAYDVNSLYPSVMAKYPMPVGQPRFFQGTRPLEDVFGFVYAHITAPAHLDKPLLGLRHSRGDIHTTLYALGS